MGNFDLVEKFRTNRPDLKGGVVVIYDGEVTAWMSELRDPHKYVDGCIAIDESGREWIARGGDYQNGAEHWEPVTQ